MIAIKRLQSIFWILVVAFGALSAYLISLHVATKRNAVVKLEQQIYQARSNIRYLEVEFSARANLRQLAEWNARDIKYSVPSAGQYLTSEAQLAALDGMAVEAPAPVMAAVVPAEPASAPAPVMIIPVKAEAPAKPASVAPTLAKASTPPEPRALPVQRTVAVAVAEPVRAKPALVRSESARMQSVGFSPRPLAEPRIVKLVDKADPAERHAMRLALLEKTLLGSKAMSKLDKADAGKAAR